MLGKQAKILAPRDVTDLLAFADCSRHPLRNRVIVMLSAKAGLRAGEIAGLTWDMVLDASGQISKSIELRDHAAKKGSGRLVPMHGGHVEGQEPIDPRFVTLRGDRNGRKRRWTAPSCLTRYRSGRRRRHA